MRAILAALSLAVAANAQAPDFAKEILPILESRCMECHKAPYQDANGILKKPKGGLRLDGRGFVEKGGKTGRVLAPGKPLQSPLYARTVLPEDDSDHMPDDGDPLTRDQTESLKRWIASGAEFGTWTGAGGPAAEDQRQEVATKDPLIERLTQGLSPVPEATLQKVRSKYARIVPLAAGSPLLRIEFLGHDPQVGDREVEALSALQDHVVELCLARTKITDKSLEAVARMRRLTQLDLRETAVTEAGIAKIATLPELRSLNLFSTQVGNAVANTLGAAKALESLYVWQSKIDADGIARIHAALPQVRIVGAPELPTAPLETGKGKGKRGKK